MKNCTIAGSLIIALAVLAACDGPDSDKTGKTVENGTAMTAEDLNTGAGENILLAPWAGPYGGVPAFDKVQVSLFPGAIETGMRRDLDEIDAITRIDAAPNFENTILALENTGRDLDRVLTYYYVWSSNKSSPEFREIQQEMAPKLAAFNSQIRQNKALFDRIAAVKNGAEYSMLEPSQQRLVDLVYQGFTRNGATLEGAAKERYAAIDQELARLYTKFANNVLADEENYVLYLDKNQLSGLPASFVTAAASAAADRGKEDLYAVTNTRSSVDPFLRYSDERELREQVWHTFYNRGDNGDEHDNNKVIQQILALRDERVGLLGYNNYADWRLEDRMAKTPARAEALMEAVWQASVARVREEVVDMQAIADNEGDGITIAPWDYRYYAEKVRKAKYDLDSGEVKQYLQLDKLREAMFYVAGELFGFKFTPVAEGTVPVFDPGMRVWEVTDKDSGKLIGIWYLDAFARPGKRSGAWATSYRSHETLNGETTVLASNNANFIKGAPGEPVLISWDDAETLFHEFGHALHSLSSRVAYPTLNSGVRDYTEFQSQLLERWLLTDPIVERFLTNVKTGEPMPQELIDKIRAAATFNQGFVTTEYLASALIDMKLHTTDPEGLNPDTFEREQLAVLGMP